MCCNFFPQSFQLPLSYPFQERIRLRPLIHNMILQCWSGKKVIEMNPHQHQVIENIVNQKLSSEHEALIR